jgi:WD40 repeat protein
LVSAVVFSRDGKTVASASGDKTIKLWDTKTGTELCILEVQDYVFSLDVSDDGSHLITNHGIYPTLLVCDKQSTTAEWTSYLSVKGNWICRGEEKIIWLPPNYRPYRIAVHKNIAVLGYSTGAVTMLELAL